MSVLINILLTTQLLFISSAHGAPVWKKVNTTASVVKTKKVQRFTSSGTWNRPTGVTDVEVFMIGGGGGGGGGCNGPGSASSGGGGGGGGGEPLRTAISAVPASLTITLGSG
ncbi:MAG: hypothetical protein K2Q26_07185, partial [Bdellovibrionales bacterium]|nr:hypothetical protein [Bdellovibrionales bacterium]